MGVEEPLHPLRRCALGQVLRRQFVHRTDEGLYSSNRLKCITVSLALVKAGIRIQRRHKQKRKNRRNQNQQGKIGKVGKPIEHAPLLDRQVQYEVGGPEAEESDPSLHENALEDVLMDVMAKFVRQDGFD